MNYRPPTQWALTVILLAVFYLYIVGAYLATLLAQPGVSDLTH